MSLAASGVVSKARHKKILKFAKGYRGRAKNCFSIAVERVYKAFSYQYKHRKCRKRDFRSLWIMRINAALRKRGLRYSSFISRLQKLNIEVNRKILADLAVYNPDSFNSIVDLVNGSTESKVIS